MRPHIMRPKEYMNVCVCAVGGDDAGHRQVCEREQVRDLVLSHLPGGLRNARVFAS
jgi:hypothetical protein